MNEDEMKQVLEEKIEQANKLIEECSRLKSEWEERIAEANQAKRNYDSLIQVLTIELNKIKVSDEVLT